MHNLSCQRATLLWSACVACSAHWSASWPSAHQSHWARAVLQKPLGLKGRMSNNALTKITSSKRARDHRGQSCGWGHLLTMSMHGQPSHVPPVSVWRVPGLGLCSLQHRSMSLNDVYDAGRDLKSQCSSAMMYEMDVAFGCRDCYTLYACQLPSQRGGTLGTTRTLHWTSQWCIFPEHARKSLNQ